MSFVPVPEFVQKRQDIPLRVNGPIVTFHYLQLYISSGFPKETLRRRFPVDTKMPIEVAQLYRQLFTAMSITLRCCPLFDRPPLACRTWRHDRSGVVYRAAHTNISSSKLSTHRLEFSMAKTRLTGSEIFMSSVTLIWCCILSTSVANPLASTTCGRSWP